MQMHVLEEFNLTNPSLNTVSPISISDPGGQKSNPSSSIHTLSVPVSTRAQNLMMQYHDFTQQNPRVAAPSPVSPEDGHHYFDCPKVWERIVMHSRFDEVDIDDLCAELNARVKLVSLPGWRTWLTVSVLRRVALVWRVMS